MQTKTHNTVLLVKQTIILLGQDSSAVSYCYEKNIPPYFHYCAYKTLNAISFLGILSQFGEISGELWIFFFTILHKKIYHTGAKTFLKEQWQSHASLSRTTDTQWRHKSKISEKLGRCGRQNILWPYLKIWEWKWIFGRVVVVGTF